MAPRDRGRSHRPLSAFFDAIPARRGHFRLESGHHTDLWLELELLYLEPERVRPLALELADRIRGLAPAVVCGPLVEGAFVALTVAAELGTEFAYAERIVSDRDALFPIEYRVPGVLRERLSGRPVAIVNDVISAGSAVRGTLADVRACGAEPVAIGALLVLGEAAERYAAEQGVLLERLVAREHAQWEPGVCPLCAAGVPLVDLSH